MILFFPVYPRASRMALIQASVPLLTILTRSTLGTMLFTSSATVMRGIGPALAAFRLIAAAVHIANGTELQFKLVASGLSINIAVLDQANIFSHPIPGAGKSFYGIRHRSGDLAGTFHKQFGLNTYLLRLKITRNDYVPHWAQN